ncbi:hypothetical protein M378DRAFT_436127 [Amanita muscaria Koide BX008]|uniref:DNA 3'-5' helicase n=1 Tax=Amanita muscaria (strain Koide BX008) TaxID=946122 RepID=A0A0C2SS60_AMAMK|nr:hypothetical protein M378DRAFT_436127 [Amanita muscaria Koide BX008]
MAAVPSVPSFDEIRSKTFEYFNKRPCAWQVHICQEILHGDRDLISIAGTGMGKTLTFWMPLIFRPQGIQLVITPLNILGEQNTAILHRIGIEAIFISGTTAKPEIFQDIASLRYRVVIANPEELMREHGGFEMLLQDKIFNSHLISIIVDEAHCISQWGSFRSDYRDIGRLRLFQRKLCPILATSATMSTGVIEDVKKVLRLREESLFVSRCSTDRSNIAIIVRPIVNPIYSYRELSFVLGDWEPGNPPPPKFIVFFDNIKYSVDAGHYLRGLLPKDEQSCINWFNSDMSDEFKRSEAERFAHGETWGLLATDSFGMGMDLPDIKLVVQYCAPTSISMLWQRFGRCVRDPSLNGIAILLAEKEYFDHLKNTTKKRKRGITTKTEPGSTAKRAKVRPLSDPTNNLSRIDDVPLDDDEGDGEQEDDTDNEQDEDEDGDEERDEDGRKEMQKDRNKRTHGMKKSKKKSKKDQIEPAIIDLLNAGQRGLGCRRRIFTDTFQNSKAARWLSSLPSCSS